MREGTTPHPLPGRRRALRRTQQGSHHQRRKKRCSGMCLRLAWWCTKLSTSHCLLTANSKCRDHVKIRDSDNISFSLYLPPPPPPPTHTHTHTHTHLIPPLIPTHHSCAYRPESDWPPSAYVTVHPHPSVDKITTPVVPGNRKPVWEYQCATHVPNLYLQSQVSMETYTFRCAVREWGSIAGSFPCFCSVLGLNFKCGANVLTVSVPSHKTEVRPRGETAI